MVANSILAMIPPQRWAKNLAGGVMAAGIVLLAQVLAFLAYESFTARSHELPLPIAGTRPISRRRRCLMRTMSSISIPR